MAASINASTSAGVVTTADTTGNLNIQSNGATVLAMPSAGVAVTGTFVPSGKITATTAGIDVPTSNLGMVNSGAYTPTLTAVTNVTGSTAFSCVYCRVGNTVMVFGQCDINVTATGNTNLRVSLPIASNISGTNLYGSGTTGYYNAILLTADAANDAANIGFSATTSGNQGSTWSFGYTVV
jgi:hypothetical protein